MSMGWKETKDSLRHYLNDSDVRVVALKGKWGTGKTYLWNELKNKDEDLKNKKPLYASCFGVGSVEKISSLLFQGVLNESRTKKASNYVARAAKGVVKGNDYLSGVVDEFIGPAQEFIVNKAIASRLIVLDDLERREGTLSLNALLGFVDALKQEGCQVLLIMNEEKVRTPENVDEWNTLKEKCIDHEITLVPSIEDAMRVGLSDDAPYRDFIKATLSELRVTNIHAIKKIDHVINSIFPEKWRNLEGQAEPLVKAVVRVVVGYQNALPERFRYKAIVDSVNLNIRHSFYYVGEEGERERKRIRGLEEYVWVCECPEFYDLIIQHVQSGHVMKDALDQFFEDWLKEVELRKVNDVATEYLMMVKVNPWVTSEDLIELARENKYRWKYLEADRLNGIVEDLKKRGESGLAEDIFKNWKDYVEELDFSSVKSYHENMRRCQSYSPNGEFNPRVENVINNALQARMDAIDIKDLIFEAVTGINRKEEIMLLNNLEVAKIKEVIQSPENKDDFYKIIYSLRERSGSDEYSKFNHNVYQAFDEIIASGKPPRFEEVIGYLFPEYIKSRQNKL